MANFKFFSDQFKESTDGKYSSKKIWGAILMALVCTSFVMDGLHFYKANPTLFFYMLVTGATLIGLRSVTKMFNRGGTK